MGQTITIEGYLIGSGDPDPLILFIDIHDTNPVVCHHIRLNDFPNKDILKENIIARVRGRILEIRNDWGYMEVTNVDSIREISNIVETVNSHWKDLSAGLLKETNSSEIDGLSGYPWFNQKTREVEIGHNVGNMQPWLYGDYTYEPEVYVKYCVNLDGKITKIFLRYPQSK